MATDKNLPAVLGTAQARVQTVSGQVAARATAVTRLGLQSAAWKGTAGKDFRRACTESALALRLQVLSLDALADQLGTAKRNAETRIQQEAIAAAAAAKKAAEAQAAAAKAAAGKK